MSGPVSLRRSMNEPSLVAHSLNRVSGTLAYTFAGRGEPLLLVHGLGGNFGFGFFGLGHAAHCSS